ncbi:MAG: RidA family protein [Acidimicrobiia bacterium]|nr:RidA family protein [Acidimicrobiia bacterium]
MHRIISPHGIPSPAANYAHAVLSSGSRMLHTSGVVPNRLEGGVPDRIGEQAAVVWSHIRSMLDEASMDVADIVSVVTYVVAGHDLTAVMAERDRFMGEHRAASTLVTVPELAQPEWKVEIAVVAVA